jgi:hypothetical protein
VIFVGYAALAIGLAMLAADVRGRFRAPPERLPALARSGVIGAAAIGVTPLLLLLSQLAPSGAEGLGASWPLALFAVGYLALALAFTLGVLRRAGDPTSTRLRRVSYLGLLVIGTVPSSLLLFAPFITLAGLGLARPSGRLSSGPA